MAIVKIIMDKSFREKEVLKMIDEDSVIYFSKDPIKHSFLDSWDVVILKWDTELESLQRFFPFACSFIVFSNVKELSFSTSEIFFDLNPSNLKISISNALKFAKQRKELEEMGARMRENESFSFFQGPIMSKFLSIFERKFNVYGDMILISEYGCKTEDMIKYVVGMKIKVLDFAVSSESAIIYSLFEGNDGFGILRSTGNGIIFFKNFHLASHAFQDTMAELLLNRSVDFKGIRYKFNGRMIMEVGEDRIDKIHKSILNLVGNGKLRIPPLRERKEDIPFIVDQYLAYLSQKNRRVFPPISEMTLKLLMNYHWPKNLDELEEVLNKYILKGEAEIINFFKSVIINDGEGYIPNLKKTVRNLTESVEKSLIEKALRVTDNNKKKASALLGISYKTLVQKMERLGINGR